MKIKSIPSGAAIIAAVMAVCAGCVAGWIDGRWWMALIVAGVQFFVAYSVALWVMDSFVVYKLKPLYQILFSRNVRTVELNEKYESAADILNNIEDELSDWAEKHRREIVRLREREQYRKDYVGNVSHEIKTPVFNIQGYISTLLDGAIDDPAVSRQYLERAGKSIERLMNIVTDLDEISKLESDTLELHPERFDIVALACECIDIVDREARLKNISITIGKPGAPPQAPIYVMADRHYISQVFVNLLNNSIRYGTDHGKTRISFVDLFGKVMVEVADDGIGIAQADIPRVFERFYRTDKGRSREQGGTGLGLSIVKHIMEAHGETITLRSELGEGSTFSFILPKSRQLKNL